MKAVMLDAATLGDDVDLSPIREVTESLTVYENTMPAQSRERLAGAQAAITNKAVLDADTLAALPELELICVMATGTNNIDLATARKLGITVRNITGYGTASVAQHTVMMMLALADRLPLYQRAVAAGDWQRSMQFCLLEHRTTQLDDKHLVIVGQGELGSRVAELARAFNMRVTFTARPGSGITDTRPTLESVIGDADILTLHCPLTEHTRHLVDDALLRRMKPEALLINCARGGIIDEMAALDALRAGRIAGLGVDVLPDEPPPDDHPLLAALDEALNLVVTPHNAWISPEARQRVVELTAANLEP